MRPETVDAFIELLKTPREECEPVTVRGRDQYGRVVEETVWIPKKQVKTDDVT